MDETRKQGLPLHPVAKTKHVDAWKRHVAKKQHAHSKEIVQKRGSFSNLASRNRLASCLRKQSYSHPPSRHDKETKSMHSSQLAELGSWVASNATKLVYGSPEQPMLVATSYWTASKIRLQRWVVALKMFEKDFDDDSSSHNPWPALEIVVQEILMSEMLTRIWSATMLTHDGHHQTDEMHGLAHSVHISHIEARNRAVRIMLKGQSADEEAFDRMNGLRRRLERWTDLFLGQLPCSDQASGLGFDRNRVVDFNEEQRDLLGPTHITRQQVLTASFSNDILRDQTPYAANPEINRDIAAGILACFPSDQFDPTGLPEAARTIWMEKSHHNTQILVDHLMELENKA